jgi:hypothetical protein
VDAERWRNRAPTRIALSLALALSACKGDRASPTTAPSASALKRAAHGGVIVVAADRGELCSDLGSIRACWGGECGRTGCVVERPFPSAVAISPLGWRCTGARAERRCFERSARAGEFACRENTCVQRHPRLPDDGEWLCADSAGAVLCTGGEPAAGVAPARAEPGWFCGTRAGARPVVKTETRAQPTAGAAPTAGTRVCVDLDPDFPDGNASHWRCRYSYERGVERICQRGKAGAVLGDRCDAAHPCVDGSHCSTGYCIASRPAPDCWLDSDCKSSACRFGSCMPVEP